ncbi:MAG: hypothetical protein QOF45_1957 [Gaiellaceae bacterium]|nr:hypothetical protein [Gaiellaceae bacterium]
MWLVIPAVTDHNLVGFANAGPGAILVTLRGSAEVWTGSWEVISPQPSDDRIWTVSYESMPASLGDVAVGSGSVDDAMDELRAVLGDAADFAVSDPGLRNFAKWLRDAVGLLDDPHPTAPYHPDMLPDVGYSLESRRLLAASTRAWVFGGLGSWNDVYLEDESIGTEYERISSRLWQAVLGGLESAVNAFEPVP